MACMRCKTGFWHRPDLRANRRRRFVSAVGTAALVLSVLGAGPAMGSVGGGAFGVRANVNALLAPVSVGPLPSVSLPGEGGGPFHASLVSASLAGLASVGVAKVSTQGNSGLGSASSSASVVDVDVARLVSVSAARSRCAATADSAEGSASVVDLVVAGIPVSTVNLGPNTTIALPVGSVVINEQRKDGASDLTVNAVRVSLNALVASGDVVIGQSRCSVRSSTARFTRARSKRARQANGRRTAR